MEGNILNFEGLTYVETPKPAAPAQVADSAALAEYIRTIQRDAWYAGFAEGEFNAGMRWKNPFTLRAITEVNGKLPSGDYA
jgi:hypothetical protein